MAEKSDAPTDAPDEAPEQVLSKVLKTNFEKTLGELRLEKKLAERTGMAREAKKKKKNRNHQKLPLSKKRAAAAEPTNICFLE